MTTGILTNIMNYQVVNYLNDESTLVSPNFWARKTLKLSLLCVFVQESVNKQRPKKIFADAKEVEITRAIAKEFYDVLQDRAECDVIIIGAGPAGLTAAREL